MNPIDYKKLNSDHAWDRYNAFYKVDNQCDFIFHFETGETILDIWSVQNYQRKTYSEMGIEIGFPAEITGGHFRLKDGTRIPKAWLEVGGQPTLMLDFKHNIAVNIDHAWGDKINQAHSNLSPHLARGKAVYTNQNAKPIGYSMIKVSRPYPLTLEQKRWVKELEKLCKVVAKLLNTRPMAQFNGQDLLAHTDMSPQEYFKTMTQEQRHYFGHGGINIGRLEIQVDHLDWVPN